MNQNIPCLKHLHIVLPHEETTTECLNHSDQRRQLLISHLLKSTQKTSFEEHLNVRKDVCQQVTYNTV